MRTILLGYVTCLVPGLLKELAENALVLHGSVMDATPYHEILNLCLCSVTVTVTVTVYRESFLRDVTAMCSMRSMRWIYFPIL
jgi:hypothetical protein